MTSTIVVPVYQTQLSEDEQLSLRQLREVLGHHPMVVVCPQQLKLPEPLRELSQIRFSDEYFRSRQGYNQLMLSEAFYAAFSSSTYILIYQLDCLVFEDRLDFWCQKGFDYIGSPWKHVNPQVQSAVGNGGFSLRKIETCLEVIREGRLSKAWARNLRWPSRYQGNAVLDYPARLLRFFGRTNTSSYQIANVTVNEDAFWSWHAQRFVHDFRIPEADEAAQFSVETDPEFWCQNQTKTPFGCHAWSRYGREFWLARLAQQKSLHFT